MPDALLRTGCGAPTSDPSGTSSMTVGYLRCALLPIVVYPRGMHAHGRPRARRSWLALAGVAAAVAIVCAVGLTRPGTAAAPPVAAVDAAAPAPAPLALPDQ